MPRSRFLYALCTRQLINCVNGVAVIARERLTCRGNVVSFGNYDVTQIVNRLIRREKLVSGSNFPTATLVAVQRPFEAALRHPNYILQLPRAENRFVIAVSSRDNVFLRVPRFLLPARRLIAIADPKQPRIRNKVADYCENFA